MKTFRLVVLLWLSCASLSLADALVTPDQLKDLLTQQKYRDVLRETARILSLSGKAAEPYNRFDVQTLRAEAQLQLKQYSDAAITFNAAAKEKVATEDQKDQALASAILMKRCKGDGFTPAPSADEPHPATLKIADPAVRPTAFPILYNESRSAANAKVKAILTDWSLNQLADVTKAVVAIQPLDRVVNKSSEDSDALLKSVLDEFAKRTDTWANEKRDRVTAMEKSASEMVEVVEPSMNPNRPPTKTQHQRGLSTDERSEIKSILSQCQQIVPVYKEVAAAAGSQASSLETIPTGVENLYKATSELAKQRFDKVLR